MRHYSFNAYLQERFKTRVHRLGLNAGFGCPNRDGTFSEQGCIFCNEEGFTRYAGKVIPLENQLEESIRFARGRYGADKFIAYFQNGSSTHSSPDVLKDTYGIIRNYPDIVGLFVSTRPDCVDEERLDVLNGFTRDYEVWVEYGLQSVHDRTLEVSGRNHTAGQAIKAIMDTADRGIKVGVHVILGLPGETEEDMMATAATLADLPVSGVKFHVLHVLKNTPLEELFREGKIELLDMNKYVNIICKFIGYLPPGCVILRLVSDAKGEFLVAPAWIQEKQKVIRAIEQRMEDLDLYQGKLLSKEDFQ